MNGTFPKFELHDEFFEGISDNPIHQSMFLPLPSIKLAQLSSSAKNMELAKLGMLEQVEFTAEEQKTYAYLQIAANHYLQAKCLVTLPLLHLTPRMLLPYYKEQEFPDVRFDDFSPLSINGNIVTTDTDEEKLKRKKKKKKKKTVANSCPELSPKESTSNEISPQIDIRDYSTQCDEKEELPNFNVNVEGLGKSVLQPPSPRMTLSRATPSWSVPEVYGALEGLSLDLNLTVKNICTSYENELVSLRERYENVVQSLNLRLYVAQAEVDRLKAVLGNKSSSSSRMLELFEKNNIDCNNL